MAATERKQVGKVGDAIASLVPVVDAPTVPIGTTVHGLTKDLTVNGTGFEAKPVNTVRPKITGTAQVGVVLTSSQGTWASQGVATFTYAWYKAGVAIGGATATTYTPVVGDIGATLTCRVTATNSQGATVAETLATAAVIAA